MRCNRYRGRMGDYGFRRGHADFGHQLISLDSTRHQGMRRRRKSIRSMPWGPTRPHKRVRRTSGGTGRTSLRWSVPAGLSAAPIEPPERVAHQRPVLNAVFASLDSGQSMMRVRVAMSVKLRPSLISPVLGCRASDRSTHHLIASSSSTLRFFILHTARPIRRSTTNPAPMLIPITAPRGMASPLLSSSFSFAVGEADA